MQKQICVLVATRWTYVTVATNVFFYRLLKMGTLWITYCIQWANNSNVHMDLTYFVWKNNYDILWRGLYKHKHSLHAVFSFQLCLSLKFQQDLHLLCFFNLFILWVCPHSASLSFCPSCLWLISPGCFPHTFYFSGLIWCPNPLVSLFIFERDKWLFLNLWSCFVNMRWQISSLKYIHCSRV